MPSLICAGEFFHDLIFYDLEDLPRLGEELKTDSFHLAFGGGAAISAVAAARLGSAAEIITVWGDSPLDAEARRRLQEFGVGEGRSGVRQGMRAGLTVSVSTRQDRYFLTSPGANRHVEAHLLEERTLEGLKAGDHVHFALTPSRWEPFQNRVARLSERSVTTSWDLGWDPRAASGDAFTRLCAALDILFLNQMEAIRYTASGNLQDALEILGRQGSLTVVKLGEQGAVACRGDERVWAEPVQVEALETTGAGDAFNGGFLHSWMEGAGLDECLLAGNICGAASTRAPGGVDALPSLPEFRTQWEALHKAPQRSKS